jgi:Signal transduction histidine kinase
LSDGRQWLAETYPRLEGREDSEHGQAIVRLAIALLILAYLWWLAQRLPSVAPMFAVMLAESLVGLGLVAWLLVKPGVSHVRRWIGMLADFSTLAILMLLNPKPLAPLYVLILWVVVGNGLRYGPRYLYSAAGLGFLAFLSVIFGNPYWRDQPYLAVGLLVGVIAIPMYLSSLLRDLHRVTEEARRANAAKTRFLATMSHELRSPLNGIIGMAELMRSTKMSVEQREFAEVIHASAQTLRLLVDDVLDIAAIEAGKLQRKESVFSLSDLINRLELLLHPQAAEKGITLDTRIASDVPDRLYGDAAHLTQILMNLLHNAVKFTDSGGVLLEVAKREASEHVVGLRFSVRDTGSGIPDEDKARIVRCVRTGRQRRDAPSWRIWIGNNHRQHLGRFAGWKGRLGG